MLGRYYYSHETNENEAQKVKDLAQAPLGGAVRQTGEKGQRKPNPDALSPLAFLRTGHPPTGGSSHLSQTEAWMWATSRGCSHTRNGLLGYRVHIPYFMHGDTETPRWVTGLAQSHTVSPQQSQSKNPALSPSTFFYTRAWEHLGLWECSLQTPSLLSSLDLGSWRLQGGGDSKQIKCSSSCRSQSEASALAPARPIARPDTPAAPEANLVPFTCPLPSPFMAFRRALASVSGLKSPAGCTVPFTCKKQKVTQQVPGGPPGARPREEHAREGRLFPHEPQTKQLGGKEAGVKAQQTDPCPRAERGRRATDPGLGAGQVLSGEERPGSCPRSQLWPSCTGTQSLGTLPCCQGLFAS